MIALHSCDSPQDLLRTAQGPLRAAVPFGRVPFPCAAVLPGPWPRGTDGHCASIQSYLSIYTFLSSLAGKVNRYFHIHTVNLTKTRPAWITTGPQGAFRDGRHSPGYRTGPDSGFPPSQKRQQTVVRLLAAALSLSDLFYRTILFLCSVQSNEFLQILVSLFCFLLVLSEHYGSFLRVGSYK